MNPKAKQIFLGFLYCLLTLFVLSVIMVYTLLFSPLFSVGLSCIVILSGILLIVSKYNKPLGWGFIIGGIASFGTLWLYIYILVDLVKDLLDLL